jgi:hypothetical protein
VNAIIVGHAIFNDLRGARTRLDPPTRDADFYTYKTVVTVWGPDTVTVKVSSPGNGVRLLYDPGTLEQLATRPPSLASLPTEAMFDVCRGRTSSSVATQYNGGFAIRRPLCATVETVMPNGLRTHRLVRFGVDQCG